MIFSTKVDSELYYLWEYVPRNRYFMDSRSNITLNFKEGYITSIRNVADAILPYLGDDFAIETTPSSRQNNNSACNVLVGLILDSVRNKNLIDERNCLYRHTVASKQHLTPSGRSTQNFLNTVEVVNQEIIRDKEVFVIDDVVTSGYSFIAAKELLMKERDDLI